MAYASTILKDEYVTKTSNYMLSNYECLNGIAEDKVLKKHLVPLLFLVKSSSCKITIADCIPTIFNAHNLPLYTKAGIYKEQVLALRSSEQRLSSTIES